MPLSIPVFWLIAGVVLCLLEVVFPTAFVELTMGISAILVGFVAQFVSSLSLQVALWLLLSVALTILLRRFVPKQTSRPIGDSKEAKTITEIPPGQTGRVLYEGNSWQARCEDEELAIAPHQKVFVVGRQGTTLIVLPQHLLHA